MKFKDFIEELKGKTFEQMSDGNVECIGNMVYEDDDLYNFLSSMGASIECFNSGYALVSTDDGKYFEIPYDMKENRFDVNLPEETVLFFDYNKIYDVTSNY